MNFIKKYFEKNINIKDNKKISLFIILGFITIGLLFFSELDVKNNKEVNTEIEKELSTTDYCIYLEEKVSEIIKSIDGAGETKVMITLSETTEYIYATNNKDLLKKNNNSNDSTYENDYVIIEKDDNDTGLLIKTIEPKIRGVAIVCEGGDNTTVQNQIYSAVSAVLNISISRISISKLKHMEGKNEK